MRVNDGRAVPARFVGDSVSESRAKPGRSTERCDVNTLCCETVGPTASRVQTANGRRQVPVKALGQVKDETFGAAGIQAENNVENTGRDRALLTDYGTRPDEPILNLG